MPLSKRLRVNFTSGAMAVRAATAVTAAPAIAVHAAAPAVRAAPHLRAALRLRAAPHGTSRSVHAFILFLDWFGEPLSPPLAASTPWCHALRCQECWQLWLNQPACREVSHHSS